MLSLVAFFLAKGVGNLLVIEVRDALPEAAMAHRRAPYAAEGNAPSSLEYQRVVRGDAVLSRNLFDSSIGALSRTPKSPEKENIEEGSPETTPLVPCESSPFRLEATLSVEDKPELSMAAVSKQRESDIYRIGDTLDGERIDYISWKYLILEREDDFCYMDLFDTRNRRPSGPLNVKTIKKGITKKGPMARVIDRNVYRRLLADPNRLMRGFKARPYNRGNTKGYKIRRLRRSHPAYLLGFRKNDVVRSVNGQSLKDMESALSALNHLDNHRRLKVDLVRGGRETTLDIRIR